MSKGGLISIDVSGITKTLKAIENYQTWLVEKSKEFLVRLADEGLEVAKAGFESAAYDGTNDTSVSVEERDDKTRAVVAVGSSVLFIEFGTGVTYPDDHPEAHELGMNRGEYGLGKGKNLTWAYYGEPGTNGYEVRDGVVLTHGNPANMPMYEAVKDLQERIQEIAREVFSR